MHAFYHSGFCIQRNLTSNFTKFVEFEQKFKTMIVREI